MEQVRLENIILNLSNENDGVRVKSENENIILSNQAIRNISNIIVNNFKVIKSYYESKIPVDLTYAFNLFDIHHISVSILLNYLYMYNSWRKMYKKHENIDLRFNTKDFDHPSTHDIILNYYKAKYPREWEDKCSILLGMDLDQLRAYYKNREAFYNR